MRKFLILILFCICVCCALGATACSKTVSVSGINFSQKNIELYVGDEYQLEYTISPENASDVDVLFYSSDDCVVTVEGDGAVLAVSQGEATITITAMGGNFSDFCNIAVQENKEFDGDSKDAESFEEEQSENTEKSEESEGLENQEQSEDAEIKEGQEDNREQDNSEQQEENQEQDEQAEVVTYAVTFVIGEDIVSVCNFTEDNLFIDEPEPPEKDGYTVEWEPYILTCENIIVNAIYTPINYTITFKANGNTVDKITFTVEDVSVEEPPVPSVAGYKGEWESYSLGCKDIIVNAVYTLINYTILYANIKSAENPNSDSYNVENIFTFENLSAEGYIFEGWYVDDDRIYSVNGYYGDLIVTAKWSLIQYEVRFVDEYYNKIATDYYTIEDSEITFPETLEKDGYTISWSAYELTYDSTVPVIVHIVYTKVEN